MDFASAQTRAMWLKRHYPKAKYSKVKHSIVSVVVSSPEEETKLGSDWFDHPTLTNAPEHERKWVYSSGYFDPVVDKESSTNESNRPNK